MTRAWARGLLLGCAWGVLARVFMRLFSTEPAFSWSGTLFILGLAGLLGGGVGLVVEARRQGRSRWWRLAPVPGLLLFAGPGMLLVPGVLGFAAALSVRPGARGGDVLRVAAPVAGTAVMLLVLVGGSDESLVEQGPAAWAGVALLLLATGLLGAAVHAWWRRWGGPETARAALAGGHRTAYPMP